jgi:ornithine decarboxylase
MTVFTGRYFVFGMPVKKINELIPALRKNKLITKLGIHFHRKTQNVSEWNYKQELEMSLSEETFSSIDSLDIGGGFPAMYKNVSDKALDIIFQRLKELCIWLEEKKIEFVIEPGRFICAPAIALEAEIINIYDNNIILNSSIYNGAMDTIVVPIKLLVKSEQEAGKSYVLKGISPCSMDIFRYDVKLKEPKIGDKITFLNAGGYNYSTDFCGFKKLKTIIVE